MVVAGEVKPVDPRFAVYAGRGALIAELKAAIRDAEEAMADIGDESESRIRRYGG